MDYKQIIDGLKWVRSPEELEVAQALREAENKGNWENVEELVLKMRSVITNPPLREAGLEKPVFYAFQARAEWEMLDLADKIGKQLKGEYGLYPAGQQGIGLNWYKLNERIWVPADYLEAISISEHTRSIFDHDERNCIGYFDVTPEDLELTRKVLYGPDSIGSSEAKIEALATNPEWRALARAYSLRLLDNAGRRYLKYVKEEFRPVLKALISAYSSEMR